MEGLGFADGKQLLRYHKGVYSWSPELTITLDVEEFDRLSELFYQQPDTPGGLKAALHALRLRFLQPFTGEEITVETPEPDFVQEFFPGILY